MRYTRRVFLSLISLFPSVAVARAEQGFTTPASASVPTADATNVYDKLHGHLSVFLHSIDHTGARTALALRPSDVDARLNSYAFSCAYYDSRELSASQVALIRSRVRVAPREIIDSGATIPKARLSSCPHGVPDVPYRDGILVACAQCRTAYDAAWRSASQRAQ